MTTLSKRSPVEVQGVSTPISIHTFIVEKDKVYQDYALSEEMKRTQLHSLECQGIIGENTALLKGESLNHPQKALQMARISRNASKKCIDQEASFRCSCSQLAVIDEEADLVMQQHLYTLKLNKGKVDPVPFAHIVLPTEYLFYTPLRERLYATSLHDLEIISREASYEGILTYAYWFSEEIDKIIPTINYSATEEYELEMRLNDYNHQTRSKVLRAVKLEIYDLLTEIDEFLKKISGHALSVVDSEKLVELEKKLIQRREELKDYCDAIVLQLQNIQDAIEKIAVTHPELIQLYYTTILLKCMMQLWSRPFQNWAQKNLINFLVDRQLGVVSYLNSAEGDQRSVYAFAARIAMLHLIKNYDTPDLIEVALNWYEHCRLLHRHHLENGAFPPHDKRLRLVYDLRNTVFNILKSTSKGGPRNGDEINREYLTLLPVFVETVDKRTINLLEIDTQTYEAICFGREVEEVLQKIE